VTEPAEGRAWRNVWVMSLTIVGTITALYSWNRVISLHLRDLGASDREIGWSYFCFTLAYRLPQILGGALTDRLGRKAIVVAGTFGMAAGYVLVGLAPRWDQVVAAICLVWMIGALQWPALAAMVAESVPENERGRAMGLLEAGSMIGLTLGPLIGERVCAVEPLSRAWRHLLLGSMAVYSLCGCARWALLRETRAQTPETQGPAAFPWRAVLLPLAVTVFTFATFFLTTDGPVLGLYVKDDVGGGPETVQTVGFYGGLAAIAGALGAGFLADRLGAGRTMLLTSVVSAFLIAPMAAGLFKPRSELTLFALLFIPGEAYIVAYQKLITSLAPRSRRGLSVGVVGSAVGLAASWAMVLGGELYTRGHRLPFVAALTVQVAAVLVGLTLLRRRYN